jgi:type IV secretory pathway VirB6-like protein
MMQMPSFIKNGLFVLVAVSILLPSLALAQITQPPDPPPVPPMNVCAERIDQVMGTTTVFPDWAYTGKVVFCLQNSIQMASTEILQLLSIYMEPVVAIMVAFAIIFLGIRILSGEKQLTRTVIGFLLRLGLVLFFSNNLGNLSGAIFAVEEQLVMMVSWNNISPWERIDIFIGKLFGMGPQIVLFQGLLGVLGGALVSSTVGVILFIAGFLAIVDILTFIIRTVFTYITSYLMIAFMIIISPLVIPMALFFYTERYFQKWLAMLIAAMITPMLLFAFLQLFLGVFSVLIASIFNTLVVDPSTGGLSCPNCDIRTPNLCDLSQCSMPDFRAFWRLNQPLFSWLVPGDPSFDQLLTIVTDENIGDPAVQSNVLPTARRALDTNILNVPSIDFGLNNIGMTQQLVFKFITLWIFASLMKSMVEKIPDIAASIANTVSGIDMHALSVKRMGREMVQDAGIGLGNLGAQKAGLLGGFGGKGSVSRRG